MPKRKEEYAESALDFIKRQRDEEISKWLTENAKNLSEKSARQLFEILDRYDRVTEEFLKNDL